MIYLTIKGFLYALIWGAPRHTTQSRWTCACGWCWSIRAEEVAFWPFRFARRCVRWVYWSLVSDVVPRWRDTPALSIGLCGFPSVSPRDLLVARDAMERRR